MKAGTTSLHGWLDAQPEIWATPRKEPHFFSQDWVWSRGLEWYRSLFDDAPPSALLGESSTSYTDPKYNATAAERIRDVVPEARLVFVARHPVDRMRSDYRHMAREGRIRTPMAEAVAHPLSGIAARSLYFECLAPYRERFPREQLLVVTFESLFGSSGSGWGAVLAHLGLGPRSAPGSRLNQAEQQMHLPRLKHFLRRTHLLRAAKRVPGPLKEAVARWTSSPSTDALLASADDELPPSIESRVWEDAAALEGWLGSGRLWER